MEEEGRKGDLGLSLMEVMMLRRNVVVKEETEVKCVGDEESGKIGKFGSEMPVCDRDSSRPPSPIQRDSSNNKQVSTVIRSERQCMDTSSRPSSSKHRNSITNSQDNQIESIKEEMGEVREENERLKAFLAQMVKDYQSLKMHFFDIVQKERFKKPAETSSTLGDVEEPELVSLSLGASAGRKRKGEEKSKENERINEDLALGLHYKIDGSSSSRSEPPSILSPDNSFEEPKEGDAGEPWPPKKTVNSSRIGEDEVLPQPPVKKARVSVRARCDAPTMNDGCQWRKYGQKTAKGNPCPRAYYRCTVAPACPVRKRVQRCAEDMSILITTYEGTHNHPLPMSATAMASTTSAAASMLTSGSSTSRLAFGSPASSTTSNADLHGFSLLDNSGLKQLYPPYQSIHCSPYHETITIDLTTPSSTPHVSFPSNTMPSSWGNGYSSYGARSYINNSHAGSLNLGRQAQDSFFLSHLNEATNPTLGAQHFLTDTIAKAIASDPSFQSAFAANMRSYVGSKGDRGVGEGSDQLSLKWSEQAASVPTYTTALAGTGCSPSYSSHQQGSLTFVPPPSALVSSKSASASPVDTGDHIS